MKITKLARLAGISVRTLHYYDEIGLLSPSRCDTNNRREYTGNDFLKLHQILYFKDLGYSLTEIRTIMESTNFDYAQSLQRQIETLKLEKDAIDQKIMHIEHVLNALTSAETPVADDQYCELFDGSSNPYREEGKRLWGTQAVTYAESLLNSMPEELKQDIPLAMQEQMLNLSKLSSSDPDSHHVQQAIRQFHVFLNQTHGNLYTLENFEQLGNYYVESRAFRDNLEGIKPGFAQFMGKAIHHYVVNHYLQ